MVTFKAAGFWILRAHSHLEPWLWSTLNCNALQSVTKLTQCNFGTSVAKGDPIPLLQPFNLTISLLLTFFFYLLIVHYKSSNRWGVNFQQFCNLNLKTRDVGP